MLNKLPLGAVPPIRDNLSQKRTLALTAFLDWVVEHRRLAVFLTRLLGAKGRQTRELLLNPELMERVERNVPLIRERVGIPDRFNAQLGRRGWAAFEDMDAEVAGRAVLLAGGGDPDGAERLLVRHFNAETIARGIGRLAEDLEPFRVRRELLIKAVEDHREGRYHASVPVVLAQLDGVADDLTGGKGFFVSPRKSAHLLAQDSIAGHQSGLVSLSATMSKERRRTSTNDHEIPYRHGILHGKDLGYDNEKVSAKAFAALIALGSWAVEVRRGQQHVDLPMLPFDPENVRLRNLTWETKAAAKALLRAWFSQSNS